MKTTFYSVTYRTWGMDFAADRWFDNREEAYNFYNSADDNLRCDRPVAHCLSNAAKIAELKAAIAECKADEAWSEECEAIADENAKAEYEADCKLGINRV